MIPISEKISTMLQAQIAHELRNEITYRQIASWANTLSLSGIAGYFSKQADGERDHAGLIMDLLRDANVPLQIPAIVPPPPSKTLAEAVNSYVETEAATTDALEAIAHVSDEEYCIGVQDLMQRMLREQVEEEGSADRLLNLVAMGESSLTIDLVLR